jgi:lipoyl(octanoyl) transferase
VIAVIQLGRVPYAQATKLQQELVMLRKEGRVPDVLLLLEHPPVITLGRNSKRANVLASDELLRGRGVEIHECDRGGDVTYHGPGQLVGYPIFDLRGFSPRIGAVDFMRRLEEVLIRTCADFGLLTQRVAGLTGVWTKPLRPMGSVGEHGAPPPEKKIAAMGIHISRGITSHGFALNVTTDLGDFELIVPCGIRDKAVTSIFEELKAHYPGRTIKPVTLDEAAQSVARNFGVVFGQEIEWVPTVDALLGRAVGVPVKKPRELREIRGEEETFLA